MLRYVQECLESMKKGKFAKTCLPGYAVPQKIVLFEKTPYTQSNKIEYKKLEEKYYKEL